MSGKPGYGHLAGKLMDYDRGYFDLETRLLEPIKNLFGPKVLPMYPVRSVTYVSGLDRLNVVDVTGFEPATPCLQSRCSPS